MQNTPPKTSRKWLHWLFPRKDSLHSTARLVFGLLGNAALLICALSRREHLFDIRDYRYVPLDLTWVFLLATIPVVVLIGVLPTLRDERPIYRRLGIALSISPAFLAIAEWLQLLTI
jgi:hypothetical protein